MSVGCYYDSKLLTATDDELMNCFYRPDLLDALELHYYEFGHKTLGKQYSFFFHVRRPKNNNFLTTGDCMAALFDTHSEREVAAKAMVRRYRKLLPVKIHPTELILVQGIAGLTRAEIPFDGTIFN